MKKTSAIIGFILISVFLCKPVRGDTQVEPEQALKMLEAQNRQFERKVVKVTENVYTAVGYHGANSSIIVGDDGVITIDTLMGPTSAKKAHVAFREISEKPVVAILYTHSHADHIGGASAFVGEKKPALYGTERFGSAEGVNAVVNPIKQQRGIRQFGRNLPDEQKTNRGVAPANTYDKDRGEGYLSPTVTVPAEGMKRTIAGVKLEFHLAPGETDDAMFIWLPEEKVLFAGDNFYHSFPNLYAIRGTAYRNVMKWSESVGAMATFQPEAVVPGHTMPIVGQEAATSALKNYSEAIRSVFDQTVEGINAGKSPEQIAHEVELPERLRKQPYLIEYYGSIHHAVRNIYVGLLGWYDGNPTTLNPLEPKTRARKMADLAGGVAVFTRKMNAALEAKDYQWALELSDYVKWLDDADRDQARKVKIAALRGLAAREYNAPNRNYYLSYANELESGKLSEVWF